MTYNMLIKALVLQSFFKSSYNFLKLWERLAVLAVFSEPVSR